MQDTFVQAETSQKKKVGVAVLAALFGVAALCALTSSTSEDPMLNTEELFLDQNNIRRFAW